VRGRLSHITCGGNNRVRVALQPPPRSHTTTSQSSQAVDESCSWMNPWSIGNHNDRNRKHAALATPPQPHHPGAPLRKADSNRRPPPSRKPHGRTLRGKSRPFSPLLLLARLSRLGSRRCRPFLSCRSTC